MGGKWEGELESTVRGGYRGVAGGHSPPPHRFSWKGVAPP